MHLNVSNNKIDQLPDNFCENMTLLETLDISHNSLSVIVSTAFDGLHKCSVSRSIQESVNKLGRCAIPSKLGTFNSQWQNRYSYIGWGTSVQM